jgi:hypothetical protein
VGPVLRLSGRAGKEVLYGPPAQASSPHPILTVTLPHALTRPAVLLPTAADVAGRLAVRLWLASMVCWWILGIQFSRLWWLVNEKQLDWILFCYAWGVPAVGLTGAVLIPWLRLRGLVHRRCARLEPAWRRVSPRTCLACRPTRRAWSWC